MIDDELLSCAAQQAREHLLSNMPETYEPEHVFSDTFEARMKRMLREQQQPAWKRRIKPFVRRAAAILLVGGIGVYSCIMGVDAWRAQLFEMVQERFSDHTRITFQNTSGREVSRGKFVPYELGYVPDEFERVEYRSSDWFTMEMYRGDGDKRVIFDQHGVDGIAIGLNTEGADLEEIKLDGGPAQYLSNHGMQTVLWYDDDYCFMLTTDLPREETLKIANSVRVRTQQSDIPADYSYEEAVDNGDVVIRQEDTVNIEQFDAFVANIEAGISGEVRVTVFTEGGVQIKDFRYNGKEIFYLTDESRDSSSEHPWIEEETFEDIEITDAGGRRREVKMVTSRYDEPVEAFRYRLPKE